MTFIDRRHGWSTVSLGAAAGSEGVAILRSADGGVHWTVVALPNLSQESFFDKATFLTASQVVMVGRYFPTSYTMLLSQDAGATPVDFGSPTSAWQLGDPIRETTDGGVSWHAVPAPALPFKTDQMSLQHLGNGIAVVWSLAAAYRTDDSGRTWRTLTPA